MIIGREKQQKRLTDLLESDKSEFVAVYGRRRVGKTYLIRETFKYNFAFQHIGIQDGNKTRQLSEFALSLQKAGATVSKKFKDWFEAFHALESFLETLPEGKKIIFIDELPWMDTPKSGFVSALGYFWNSWATMRKDVLLIICGSATSWIISNIVMNYGGLHNRLTRQIYLQPFNLHECELYVKSRDLVMTRQQILETYMILGGIPYYWTFLQRELSQVQNIDNMFFSENADLKNEFDALYASLFKNPAPYIQIITILCKRKAGMTRNEIIAALGKSAGGTLSTILKELEQCDFIRAYNPIGKATKETVYQLIDNYTLFYFKFINENRKHDPQFWTHSVNKPAYFAWCGLAFERVCLLHLEQIKRALGISGILCNVCSWVYRPKDEYETGVQIDLIIDRDDNVINLCEIKFSSGKYEIKKQYDEILRRRASVFASKTETRKAVRTIMITTYGLLRNAYANDILNQVVMDDLFLAE